MGFLAADRDKVRLMPYSPAQIDCSHWDLGRFPGVCGEAGGGVGLHRGSFRLGRLGNVGASLNLYSLY
ncbi:hypothetical protein OGCDGJMD_01986 [Cyanobium usitatum str. Tous]|nr:hypothetical protein OGCDGJMD_01986 [Cyanobium usitatum str. Tous]